MTAGSGARRFTTAADTVTAATPFALRFAAGLLWLSNVSWKAPPDFGETAARCRGLCGFVQAGIDHPVAPGAPWVLREIVRPNLEVFGWVVLLVELTLAVLLLSGTLTRLAALLGAAQSAAVGLSVANAPGEWYWTYALMAALHLAVFALAAGRSLGVDRILRRDRAPLPPWIEALT